MEPIPIKWHTLNSYRRQKGIEIGTGARKNLVPFMKTTHYVVVRFKNGTGFEAAPYPVVEGISQPCSSQVPARLQPVPWSWYRLQSWSGVICGAPNSANAYNVVHETSPNPAVSKL